MNTNSTTFQSSRGGGTPQKTVVNATAYDQYNNYRLILQLYTIHKNEVLAAKEIKVTPKITQIAPVPKSGESIFVKIKNSFNQLFGSVVPQTISISE